jgi:hypothetical protein
MSTHPPTPEEVAAEIELYKKFSELASNAGVSVSIVARVAYYIAWQTEMLMGDPEGFRATLPQMRRAFEKAWEAEQAMMASKPH